MSTLTPCKVMLEYFHAWPNSAGFYIAREQGWYQELGLEVELAVADPALGDGLSYVAAQRADFAITPTNRLLVRRDAGEPLVSVAAINHTGLESIQTLRSSGIRRPRDLCGKRLSLNPTPRGLAMVHHLVSNDGGDPDQVILIDSGVRELTPEELLAGKADASFGGYWAWEALMASSVDPAERVVLKVNDIGAPRYHSYVLATHQQQLDHHKDKLQRFLSATARGFYQAAADPQAAVALYQQVTPWFSDDLLAASAENIAPTWLHEGKWGFHQQALMEEYAGWLHHYHILKNADSWQGLATNQLLEAAL